MKLTDQFNTRIKPISIKRSDEKHFSSTLLDTPLLQSRRKVIDNKSSKFSTFQLTPMERYLLTITNDDLIKLNDVELASMLHQKHIITIQRYLLSNECESGIENLFPCYNDVNKVSSKLVSIKDTIKFAKIILETLNEFSWKGEIERTHNNEVQTSTNTQQIGQQIDRHKSYGEIDCKSVSPRDKTMFCSHFQNYGMKAAVNVAYVQEPRRSCNIERPLGCYTVGMNDIYMSSLDYKQCSNLNTRLHFRSLNHLEILIDQIVKLAEYYLSFWSNSRIKLSHFNLYRLLADRAIIGPLIERRINLYNAYRFMLIKSGDDSGKTDKMTLQDLIRLYEEGIDSLYIGRIIKLNSIAYKVVYPSPIFQNYNMISTLVNNESSSRLSLVAKYWRTETDRRSKILYSENILESDPYKQCGVPWSKLQKWVESIDCNVKERAFNNLTSTMAKRISGNLLRNKPFGVNAEIDVNVIDSDKDIFIFRCNERILAPLRKWQQERIDPSKCYDLSRLIWIVASKNVNLRYLLIHVSSSLLLNMMKLLVALLYYRDNPNINFYSMRAVDFIITEFDKLSWNDQVIITRTYFNGGATPYMLTSQQMLNALLNQDLPLIDSNYITKYEFYCQLTLTAQKLLIKLYNRPLTLIAVIDDDCRSRMETLIIEHQTDYGLTIAQKVGIYIQPTIDDIESYVINNLIYYQPVVDRPVITPINFNNLSSLNLDYLSMFGDIELMRHFNCYIRYFSRFDLLSKLYRYLYRNSFFVPIIRKSVNMETLMLTPTEDYDQFMVAYGTIFNYQLYEPEEFSHCFKLIPLHDQSTSEIRPNNSHQLSPDQPNSNQFPNDQSNPSTSLANDINYNSSSVDPPINNTTQVDPNERLTDVITSVSLSNQLSNYIDNQYNENNDQYNENNDQYYEDFRSVFLPYNEMSLLDEFPVPNNESPLPLLSSENGDSSSDETTEFTNVSSQYSRSDLINSFQSITDSIMDVLYFNESNSDNISSSNISNDNDLSNSNNSIASSSNNLFDENVIDRRVDVSSLIDDMLNIGFNNENTSIVDSQLNFWNRDLFMNHTVLDVPSHQAVFTQPTNLDNEFTDKELTVLFTLLYEYTLDQSKSIDGSTKRQLIMIMNIIDIGLEYREQMRELRQTITNSLQNLSEADLDLARNWLYCLFYTGMYMRRWQGPNYPYPLNEESTLIEINEPSIESSSQTSFTQSTSAQSTSAQSASAQSSTEASSAQLASAQSSTEASSAQSTTEVSSTEASSAQTASSDTSSIVSLDPSHEKATLNNLAKLADIEDNMSTSLKSTLRQLPAYDLRRGKVIRHRKLIDDYIKLVASNNNTDLSCIRVNSTIFIGTAYIYIQIVLNESIPNFNVNIAGIE